MTGPYLDPGAISLTSSQVREMKALDGDRNHKPSAKNTSRMYVKLQEMGMVTQIIEPNGIPRWSLTPLGAKSLLQYTAFLLQDYPE